MNNFYCDEDGALRVVPGSNINPTIAEAIKVTALLDDIAVSYTHLTLPTKA